MLLGTFTGVLSEKRRVAVPNKFRKELGEVLIVAKWYEGCLVVVNSKNWEELLQKLTGPIERITAPVRDTDRFILGSAFEVETDDQGRAVLPKTLTDYAELKSEVIFLGLGNRVEIWDKSAWEKREQYVSEHAGEFIEELSNGNK